MTITTGGGDITYLVNSTRVGHKGCAAIIDDHDHRQEGAFLLIRKLDLAYNVAEFTFHVRYGC